MKNEHPTFRPIVPPLKRLTITPERGLLGMAKGLATQCGLGALWDGEDGLEGVVKQKLGEIGIPLELNFPSRGLTLRALAEQSGFIGKPGRPNRRGLR